MNVLIVMVTVNKFVLTLMEVTYVPVLMDSNWVRKDFAQVLNYISYSVNIVFE